MTENDSHDHDRIVKQSKPRKHFVTKFQSFKRDENNKIINKSKTQIIYIFKTTY